MGELISCSYGGDYAILCGTGHFDYLPCAAVLYNSYYLCMTEATEQVSKTAETLY